MTSRFIAFINIPAQTVPCSTRIAVVGTLLGFASNTMGTFRDRGNISLIGFPGSLVILSIIMDFFTSIPTHIDYVGQAKAEKLYRAIITLFSIVGFVWGYIVQQFSQSVYILGAGFILAAILTVPPWPMYRRNPLNWQNPRSNEEKPAGKKGKK